MRDSTMRQYRYINVFTLKWQNTEPQGNADPSNKLNTKILLLGTRSRTKLGGYLAGEFGYCL